MAKRLTASQVDAMVASGKSITTAPTLIGKANGLWVAS